MAKTILEAQIKDIGYIFRADAPFDEALTQLRIRGVRCPISARDLAYARIQEGRGNSLGNNGSYTKEGFLYLKNNPVLLALNSPLLSQRLAKKAVQANKNGSYFFTENEQAYEKAMAKAEKDKDKKPEKRKVLILPDNKGFSISENENFEVLQGLLKDQAESYLDFNGQNIPVYLIDENNVNSGKGTLLTQLWFSFLDSGSELDGDGDLGYGYRVRGVLSSAEGTQKKSGKTQIQVPKLPYTQKQLDRISKIIQGVREGRLPASNLEKALNFLETIK